MSSKRPWFVAIALISALIACGGGMAPDARKSTTPSPSTNDESDTSVQSTPTGRPEAVPQAGSFARPPSPNRAALDRAEAQLDASIGDCATACRALASMESAASHLCQLDDASECSDAKRRVTAARERVERACGKCP